MNKKGFIFIISAIIIVAILLLVFLTFDEYSFSDETVANHRRLAFANDFVEGFNQDLERAIRIATFRTLIALEEHVASKGNFLEDLEGSFAETVFNGTVNGEPVNIMENSSISEYIRRINIIGDRLGLQAKFEVNEIIMNQSSPWSVDVYVDSNVTVFDTADLASWSFSKIYFSEVPIDNLRDPLYSVFTQNRFYNSIRRFEDRTLSGNSSDDLELLVSNSYYVESTSAPSFIQRFTNNYSASPYGIESVVNIIVISDQEIVVHPNRIKVDFIYFNNLDLDRVCVDDFDDYYLILPDDRLALYGFDDLPSSPC